MTPDQLDGARRLVAHPKWRWVDGMAACPWGDSRSERIHLVRTPDGIEPSWGANEKQWYGLTPEAVPDLSDYATAAIVLRMAMDTPRKKWCDHPDLGTSAAMALLAAWDTKSMQLATEVRNAEADAIEVTVGAKPVAQKGAVRITDGSGEVLATIPLPPDWWLDPSRRSS